MQILTTNYWIEVREQYKRAKGGTEGSEGDCNTVGRTTVSTNPDPSELPETKPSSVHKLDLSLFSIVSILIIMCCMEFLFQYCPFGVLNASCTIIDIFLFRSGK